MLPPRPAPEDQAFDDRCTMRFLIVSAPKPRATTAPHGLRKLRFCVCCRAVVIKPSNASASTIASRIQLEPRFPLGSQEA